MKGLLVVVLGLFVAFLAVMANLMSAVGTVLTLVSIGLVIGGTVIGVADVTAQRPLCNKSRS